MSDYIKMSIPKTAIDEGGAAREWAIDLAVKGLSRNTGPMGADIQSEALAEVVTLAHVQGVVALGGSVAAWPCWILLDSADLEEDVPEGLPNRLDSEIVRTWAQWHNPALSTGPRFSLDGMLVLIAGDGFGVRLTGAEVAALAAGGYQVLSAAETRDILATDDWTEPEPQE